MAIIRGTNSLAAIDAEDAVDPFSTGSPLGEMADWAYEETAERIDASAMGTGAKRFVAGAQETSVTLTCWWNIIAAATDPAGDAGQDLLVIGDTVSLALRPNGTGTGKPELYAAKFNVTGRSAAAGGVDGVVGMTYEGSIDGKWVEQVQV